MSWKRIRWGAAAVLVAVTGLAGGCDAVDELLQADNPERMLEEELNNKDLVKVLVNSAVGNLQRQYDDMVIWRGTMFTDEQVTGINWEQTARLNQRLIRFDEGDADDVFSYLSRSRAMADSASGLLRTLLEKPDSDARLATTLAYAGYSYLLMGEMLCEGAVSGGGNLADKVLTPNEMTQMGVAKLEQALKVAEAAGKQDLANLARVGLARGHLQLGNKAQVKQYAAAVPASFVWWVEYSENSPDQYNVLYSRTTGSNHALGVHPKFLNGEFGKQGLSSTQTDSRVQHTPNWSLGHNRLTKLYKPFQGLSFSGFNGQTIASGGKPAAFERGTKVKLASGLEARHAYAEADGPTAATLAFVNERRAFGKQEVAVLDGDALMAELREQRGRDFYLDGHRLGDLRRWKAQGVNLFPAGVHPNNQWGQYGEATCFPMPVEEYEANPNLKKPVG